LPGDCQNLGRNGGETGELEATRRAGGGC
jgi:hypothetical protein